MYDPTFSRRAVRRQTDLLINEYEDGIASICRVRNISCTGMRVERLQSGRQGTSRHVELEFQLPGETQSMIVRAERIRQDSDNEFGIRFRDLDHGVYKRLRAWAVDL